MESFHEIDCRRESETKALIAPNDLDPSINLPPCRPFAAIRGAFSSHDTRAVGVGFELPTQEGLNSSRKFNAAQAEIPQKRLKITRLAVSLSREVRYERTARTKAAVQSKSTGRSDRLLGHFPETVFPIEPACAGSVIERIDVNRTSRPVAGDFFRGLEALASNAIDLIPYYKV
jgi:hypothetical protein